MIPRWLILWMLFVAGSLIYATKERKYWLGFIFGILGLVFSRINMQSLAGENVGLKLEIGQCAVQISVRLPRHVFAIGFAIGFGYLYLPYAFPVQNWESLVAFVLTAFIHLFIVFGLGYDVMFRPRTNDGTSNVGRLLGRNSDNEQPASVGHSEHTDTVASDDHTAHGGAA